MHNYEIWIYSGTLTLKILTILSLFYLFIVILVAFDLISKWAFSGFLANTTIPLIGNLLTLRLAHNTGVAFSFPIEGIVLKILTVGLIAVIMVYYTRYEQHRDAALVRTAYALILVGAIANGVERIWNGSVIDFIAVKYFAIFNFADIFISVGAILLFFFYSCHERDAKKSN